MAFTVSRSESALTAEREKESIDKNHTDIRENIKDSSKVGDGISSQLHLKSPSQTVMILRIRMITSELSM
ncbi:hypothetical protein P8452_71736 [Trifolium repens]|jgi:hypothetical protein|nr:hypothetical protein P8452_71736 [Trifolium repens]